VEQKASRDYLLVDDFVAAVMALLKYQGSQTVFNVSSGEGKSVNEILAIIKKISNRFLKLSILKSVSSMFR
jgi:UDP-glucose 4-epimerase